MSVKLSEDLPFGTAQVRGNGWALNVPPERGAVWLCPECFQPADRLTGVPDEENRPCDCSVALAPYLPCIDTRVGDEEASEETT